MSARRVVVAVLLAAALSGCGRSFERETVDGVECVVYRNGLGRPAAVSCNWEDQ